MLKARALRFGAVKVHTPSSPLSSRSRTRGSRGSTRSTTSPSQSAALRSSRSFGDLPAGKYTCNCKEALAERRERERELEETDLDFGCKEALVYEHALLSFLIVAAAESAVVHYHGTTAGCQLAVACARIRRPADGKYRLQI